MIRDEEIATRFPRTHRMIQQGIDERRHLGMQVSLSIDGQPLADFALGDNIPGSPLSHDTLMPWLSSGKPITAAAVLRLIDGGDLRLDQPVREVIPEFGERGKEDVTIRHLLTHTVGLRPIHAGWPEKSWDEILAKVCSTAIRAGWRLGQQAAYDPHRTWFVLGEILQRIHQRPIELILRREVLEPLGMNSSGLAVPDGRLESLAPRIGVMHALQGEELVPTSLHLRPAISAPSPGSSFRGPARELGRFYEMLLRGGASADGTQFLAERTVREMTRRQREGMFDETFQHQVDFGLGLIINSNRYGWETVPYGFGRHAADASWGHGGSQSSIGFADPVHRLVVVAIANGSPGELLHNERNREITAAIYEDLGLTGPVNRA